MYVLHIRIALLLAAVAVTVLHLFFCRCLNRKPVDYEFSASPSFVQDYYASIGNALPIITEAALRSALAIVFVQEICRKHSIGQIVGVLSC